MVGRPDAEREPPPAGHLGGEGLAGHAARAEHVRDHHSGTHVLAGSRRRRRVAGRTGRRGLLSAAWFAGVPAAVGEGDELLGVVGERLADLLLPGGVVVVEVPEEISEAGSGHTRTLLLQTRGGPRHSDISRAPWYMSPPWHAVVTRGCWCSPPSPSSSVWRRAAGRGSAAPRWPRPAGRSRPAPPRRSGISPRPKADRPLPRAEGPGRPRPVRSPRGQSMGSPVPAAPPAPRPPPARARRELPPAAACRRRVRQPATAPPSARPRPAAPAARPPGPSRPPAARRRPGRRPGPL